MMRFKICRPFFANKKISTQKKILKYKKLNHQIYEMIAKIENIIIFV